MERSSLIIEIIARFSVGWGGAGRAEAELHDGGLPVDRLQPVEGLLGGLGVLVLVVRQPVAELLVVHPA